MTNQCFHNWIQTGKLSDDEYQCLKCGERIAYRKDTSRQLSKNEIEMLAIEHHVDASFDKYFFEFVRAIERAHGIEGEA